MMIVYGMDSGDDVREATCISVPPGVSAGEVIGVPDGKVVIVYADGMTVRILGSTAAGLSREGISVGCRAKKINGAAVGIVVCWIEFKGLALVNVSLLDGFVVGVSLTVKLG